MSEPTEPPTPEAPSDDTPEETTAAPVAAGPPTTAAPAPPSEGKSPLTSVSDLGVASDKNARYRRVMEDAHVYVDGFGGDSTTGYFAVYDGHGGRGAVEYVRDHLHENLLQSLISHPHSVEAALKDSYAVTDSQIAEAKIQFSGTTTVSALLRVEQDGSKKLYVANVGDARAILNHGGKAIRLTFDHKGSDEGEVKRIQEAGGFVVMNRVNGILAVTRSLGDCAMKDYVSGEPYISTTVLTPEDTHLIIACDGVWDVITDDGALEIIAECENCTEAAKKLLIQSLKRGSTDNISVMVIKL